MWLSSLGTKSSQAPFYTLGPFAVKQSTPQNRHYVIWGFLIGPTRIGWNLRVQNGAFQECRSQSYRQLWQEIVPFISSIDLVIVEFTRFEWSVVRSKSFCIIKPPKLKISTIIFTGTRGHTYLPFLYKISKELNAPSKSRSQNNAKPTRLNSRPW
jgi:hypothetical protein